MRRTSWNIALAEWDAWCGWRFAERTVKVVLTPKLQQGTNKCRKCEAAFQARDKVKGGVSFAQLISLDDDKQPKDAV
jgi:hypothetical protein